MAVNPDVNFGDAQRPAGGGDSGGSAGREQFRIADHTYTGGNGGGSALAGANRPNPREISNIVFNQLDGDGDPVSRPSEDGYSNLLWVWGQFLDHDMVQTDNGAAFGSAPIAVPAGDPVFTPGTTLGFNRSQFITGTGTSAANPREYASDITALLDSSNIYGSSEAKLDALLQPNSAKLRLSESGTIAFATGSAVFGNGVVTGDTRANENVGLLSMHALFAREHNRLVDELRAADPTLTRSELFEGARARVEAIAQAITYNEYLPILIGENALDDYSGFKANVNPAMSLEFTTAAYRFGHSLLSASISRVTENGATEALGDLALRDAFNTRGVVEQTGVGSIFRGLADTMSQNFDTFFVEDVRSLLFGRGGPGTDLAALNIQRGRDHGLPTYNGMREALGLDPITSFSQISSDREIVERLTEAYGNVNRIDLYVGGLAEDPVAGGIMGETYRALMIDQFTRLRDGDRFWSEGRGFGAAELDELWSTTLSDVIQRNTDVRHLQADAFLAFDRRGGTAGADTIIGGTGRNLIFGAGGDDRLVGNAGEDQLHGELGGDQLEGRRGDDRVLGGLGDDMLLGNSGRDEVFGGDGDDALRIRAGEAVNDIMDGGSGDGDRLGIEASGGNATLAGTGAITNIEIIDGNDRSVVGTSAADRFDFTIFDEVTEVAAIRGNGGGDMIFGSAVADVVVGGAGDDAVDGGSGDDMLFGGEGRDRFTGRRGDDEISGGSGNDAFVYSGAEPSGSDRITDFDAGSNDALRLLGFDFGSNDPDDLSNQDRRDAVEDAMTFGANGATIDLDDLGGSGQVRLVGVSALSFTNSEDLLFV